MLCRRIDTHLPLWVQPSMSPKCNELSQDAVEQPSVDLTCITTSNGHHRTYHTAFTACTAHSRIHVQTCVCHGRRGDARASQGGQACTAYKVCCLAKCRRAHPCVQAPRVLSPGVRQQVPRKGGILSMFPSYHDEGTSQAPTPCPWWVSPNAALLPEMQGLIATSNYTTSIEVPSGRSVV